MKIFDVHTHVFPEKIAASALAFLREQSADLPTYTLGTAADLRRHAAAAGYAGWMNCPVVTKPGQSASVNAWAAARNLWPALSLGGVHPASGTQPGSRCSGNGACRPADGHSRAGRFPASAKP